MLYKTSCDLPAKLDANVTVEFAVLLPALYPWNVHPDIAFAFGNVTLDKYVPDSPYGFQYWSNSEYELVGATPPFICKILFPIAYKLTSLSVLYVNVWAFEYSADKSFDVVLHPAKLHP